MRRLLGRTRPDEKTELAQFSLSDLTTREHVVWAYRLFLGRDPESDAIIGEKLANCPTVHELKEVLLSSYEFRISHAHLCLASLPLHVICELDGFRLHLDLASRFDLSIARRTHEPDEVDFVRRSVSAGDVTLDLGAYVGLFTFTMAARGCHVHAFEPVPRHADLIQRSIDENGLKELVTLHRAAVGREPGTTKLVLPQLELDSVIGRTTDAVPEDDRFAAVDVRVESLDACTFGGRVRLIKMDVEGAEPRCIEGGRNLITSDRPVILSEINPTALRDVSACEPADYIDMLRGLGYEARLLEDGLPGAPVGIPGTEVATVVFLPSRE